MKVTFVRERSLFGSSRGGAAARWFGSSGAVRTALQQRTRERDAGCRLFFGEDRRPGCERYGTSMQRRGWIGTGDLFCLLRRAVRYCSCERRTSRKAERENVARYKYTRAMWRELIGCDWKGCIGGVAALLPAACGGTQRRRGCPTKETMGARSQEEGDKRERKMTRDGVWCAGVGVLA